MKAGDICKVGLIQPDGTVKDRPVVLIKEVPPFNDWIVAVVTSRIRNMEPSIDYLLKDTEPGFSNTGLRKTSLIRLGLINTINSGLIKGVIGELSYGVLNILKTNLSQFIVK